MSFLIEDSVRWIAGESGDWQVTGSSLIRCQSIIEVLTLTFSAINLSQNDCGDFIFLWQGVWYCASGRVTTGYRGPVKHRLLPSKITVTLRASWLWLLSSQSGQITHTEPTAAWGLSPACSHKMIILLIWNINYLQSELDLKIYNHAFCWVGWTPRAKCRTAHFAAVSST